MYVSKIREFNLSVLGTTVSFRAGADPKRVEKAVALLEEQYEKIGTHGGRGDKETLLIFLAIGLADDLLQSHQQLIDVQKRIDNLLNKIDDIK